MSEGDLNPEAREISPIRGNFHGSRITAGARGHRDKAFKNHFLTALPYRGNGPAIPVLLLVSAAGGNIPTASILDDRQFQATVLVTEYADPKISLPHHDLVFNSIGDADLCREGLEAACSVLVRTDRPVINHPRAVLKTGRATNAERLRGLPGVVAPRMVTLPRRLLAGPAAAAAIAREGFAFPFLVRSPGFHTGRHFVRVENLQSLAAAATEFPGSHKERSSLSHHSVHIRAARIAKRSQGR